MSAERLKAIKARAAAATDGPWLSDGEQHVHQPGYDAKDDPVAITAAGSYRRQRADAEFIAASRADVDWLVQQVEQLAEEVERLEADGIVNGFGIERMEATGSGLDLNTVANTEDAKHLVAVMSDSLGQMLDEGDAPNYVEARIAKAGSPGYVLHVRRDRGKSPHELRQEAEAERDALQARLDAVTAVVDKWEATQARNREQLREGPSGNEFAIGLLQRGAIPEDFRGALNGDPDE